MSLLRPSASEAAVCAACWSPRSLWDMGVPKRCRGTPPERPPTEWPYRARPRWCDTRPPPGPADRRDKAGAPPSGDQGHGRSGSALRGMAPSTESGTTPSAGGRVRTVSASDLHRSTTPSQDERSVERRCRRFRHRTDRRGDASAAGGDAVQGAPGHVAPLEGKDAIRFAVAVASLWCHTNARR